MLENDAQSLRSLSDLVNDTLLEKGKTACSVGLSTEKHKNRTARLVVRVIEPVSQVEGLVAVRLVPCLVVEEVDWYGDVVLWVQQRRVCVFAFCQTPPCLGSLYLVICELCLLCVGVLPENGFYPSSSVPSAAGCNTQAHKAGTPARRSCPLCEHQALIRVSCALNVLIFQI
jgi:hypothetical protein